MENIFCPMIHGGLNVDLKADNDLGYNQCCLSTTPMTFIDRDQVNWNCDQLVDNRDKNNSNQWLSGCWQCETLEKTGAKSFRKSMIEKFGVDKNLTGPQRIDLLFDRSCNLACRTCGPKSSTFWEKHLKENNLPVRSAPPSYSGERIKQILQSLNLENLGMVQFCGGETLMGNGYWQVAQWLAENAPNPKQNLELGFQTNGTQPIDPRWFEVIDKFKLVKLMISIDGVGNKFEYLRWPASWNQTVDNIMTLRETLPSNVMFFVQECTSCLNLLYHSEVKDWVSKHFNTNREGDPVDHTTQLAMHGYLDPKNITQEYADVIGKTSMAPILPKNWKENPEWIKFFLKETEKFDKIRNENWKKVFPEVAELYRRYL
jgi:sulfatase maturation enzyme AslB (radical SAM superfamily)